MVGGAPVDRVQGKDSLEVGAFSRL
jgi:hypothetical protein